MMKQEFVTQESGVLTLLRICTVLLAAVSFWSTAQGMREYTFPDGWQPYAASLGVQGLLLGLNFALPSFLRRCNTGQRLTLILLTISVLFCSSWFSYLYIAQRAYGDSWDTERRLAAQSTYREQLFAADDYVERYQRSVELTLAEEVSTLYDQAVAMDANKIDVNEHLDWSVERGLYAAGTSAAADVMNQVIDAMEDATAENAAQTTREQASSILTALQETLQERINAVEPRIETATSTVNAVSERLQRAQTNLRNAPDDTNLDYYHEAVTSAAQSYERTLSQLTRLERECDDYQDALQRVAYYLTTLGMAQEGVSIYYIGASLREIQNELFRVEPDPTRMQAIAAEIFNRLQGAVDLGSGTTDDADASNEEYQSLISHMNRFMQNLTRYGTLKDAATALQMRVQNLSDGKILPIDASAQSDGWQARWVSQFSDLKSLISALPVYIPDSEADQDGSLAGFKRTASADKLDSAIHKYLTRHNPAQQGLIYLSSSYKSLAIFSVFLAFLLDIAAFVTGVIIDSMSSASNEDTHEETDSGATAIETHAPAWAITRGLNRYLFLTGDYSYQDGIVTYLAIENGEETKVDLPSLNHTAGFYIWQNGSVVPVTDAELRFSGEVNGPRDGVYQSCTLSCQNDLLILDQGRGGKFLGAIDPHTPVYQLSTDVYDATAAKDLGGIGAKTAIIALNADGTKIAAVYMIIL